MPFKRFRSDVACDDVKVKENTDDVKVKENTDLKEKLDKLEKENQNLESQSSLINRECDSNQKNFQESNDALRTKLGFIFDTNNHIKEEIEKALYTAQAQHVIDKQATEIRQLKADLHLANGETRKEIGRKLQLQVELDEFKMNAAVIQREKEELEKEMVALKESVIQQKTDWRCIELQINADNYGLKRALSHLGKVNQRMLETNESLQFSTGIANHLAEKHEAEKDYLQSTIVQLEQEVIQSRQTIELLQLENQEMWNNRETFVLSAQKVEKLALEQMAALSNALRELELAVKCSKGVTESENIDLQNSDELNQTDSKSTRNTSWLKQWLIKCGLIKPKPEESELTKLLRGTGILMMERAKDLKEQAQTVAGTGKELTKRAKQLSKN